MKPLFIKSENLSLSKSFSVYKEHIRAFVQFHVYIYIYIYVVEVNINAMGMSIFLLPMEFLHSGRKLPSLLYF